MCYALVNRFPWRCSGGIKILHALRWKGFHRLQGIRALDRGPRVVRQEVRAFSVTIVRRASPPLSE